MTTSERLVQIQRVWRADLKYRIPADPQARELHEAVGDLLDEIDDIEDTLGEDFGYDFDGISEEDHVARIKDLEREHAERIGQFAPVIEDLHRQAHGDTSLFLCPSEPCRGVYRLLPNAQGRILI